MLFFWAFYKDPKEMPDSSHSPVFAHGYPNSPLPSFTGYGTETMFYLYDLFNYSCQPYLIKVIERVVAAMGFKLRRNDINHTWLRNLYICNYKPSKRRDWSFNPDTNTFPADVALRLPMTKALPHWSVSTFIDEVEKLCACIFLFNTYNKTVDIIQLDKFLKFSQEVKDTIETHNHYADYESLKTAYDGLSVSGRQKVLFVDDRTGREYICYVDDGGSDKMLEVNVWSDLMRADGGSGDIELKIVPANSRLYGIGWWFDDFQSAPSAGLDLHIPFAEQGEVADPEYTTDKTS